DPPKDAKPGVFDELANNKLYYHALGAAQADDALIFERKDQPKWQFNGQVSDDSRVLFVSITSGTSNRNALYYAFLAEPGKPGTPTLKAKVVPLVEDIQSQYQPLGNEGSVIYMLTTHKAPKKKIIAVDLRGPDRKNWVTIVPEANDAIENALI